MTTSDRSTVLVVDDDPHVLAALKDLFIDDYVVITASSGPEAIESARTHDNIAVVVMDIKMEGMDGIRAARGISVFRPGTPVIFHTGYPGEYDEATIDVGERPFDFITKGTSSQRLIRSVKNGVEAWRLKHDLSRLYDIGERQFQMIGHSRLMLDVYQQILRIAPLDTKVVILGETGTGKELVAKALHSLSHRTGKRWAVFNCNHKNPELVEAELFGYVKGAFTDAKDNHVGLFEYANGGTMFLDEIGDLDITTQGKLLRVLESGEYQPIGSPETRYTDVRLVCATHRNLEELVKQNLFREDLYYRLRGVEIRLPALRERREDIPLLAEYYKDKETIAKDMPPKFIDPAALETLINYDWPGNVRQLEDSIKSLVLLTDSHLILDSDVRHQLRMNKDATSHPCEDQSLAGRVRAFRRNCIIEALHQSKNNISEAARILGVDRNNLRKEIHQFGIPMD
jgi:two-component system, NtrC family, nitrogen regulation response regulator NtrX